MAQTVVALYNKLADAHRVVEALDDAGFERKQISLATPNPEEDGVIMETRDEDEEGGLRDSTASGAIAGGILGGLAGLLFGLSAFSIPGVGPLLIAGPLYTTVMGAGAGGLGGGLLGAMVDAGIPETEAVYYEEGVRRGHTLVAVALDEDLARRAARIMAQFNPLDIRREATGWQEEGWDAPNEVPDRFIPSTDDESDQHKYATGAMGEDMYGGRADRDRPPLPTYEEDDTEV